MSYAQIAKASGVPTNPIARCLFLLGSGGSLIGLLAGILAMFVTGAYTSSFSGADECAHFLNSYFINSYLREHVGANPLGMHNVILMRTSNEPTSPHSQLSAKEALRVPESPFKRVALLPHDGGPGTTEVYTSAIDIAPDLETVRQPGIPT